MTKQQTIERITDYLPHLDEDVLQSVLTLLERVQPDLASDKDAWDRQMLADAESGRLDSLIDQALTNHRAGDSSDLLEELASRSKAKPFL